MHDLRRRFRRRFALISTAVTLAVAAGVAVLITSTYWNLLMSIGEHRHGEMAAEFYGAATKQSGSFLDQARALGPEAARRHPEASRLTELAKTFGRATPLARLSIHDTDGFTLFSTDPQQVGAGPANWGSFTAARAGKVVAVRREMAAFRALDGTVETRMVMETFVPVRTPDGRTAIISVYTDTSGYQGIVWRYLSTLIAVVVGALFAVLGMLIFYVGRDRMLAEQQAKNAALAEAARLAEEASRLKSRFVASMGHELRTPLNAIIGFSEAMKGKIFGPLGPKYEEYAATIHASGRHLLAVVNDILDMARIDAGKVELNETVFPLHDALTHCARLIGGEAARHGLTLSVKLPESLPAFRGDEAKINQIVLNLLSNAVRYTPRGGALMLTAERSTGGSVAISVCDTGIGIPANELERVFEPFRQVENAKVKKSGGLGLGLNIAKAFADLHGAELMLESEVGRGTTARLVLPATRCAVMDPSGLPAAA
jgi:signal transduction histidine kinase